MVNVEWLQMDVRELWEKLTEVQRRLVVGIGIAVLGLFGYWLESRPDGAVVAETPVAMKPAASVATPEAKSRMDAGAFRLVGAVYELETGRVRFLD